MAPLGWGIGRTENGWMDSASFHELFFERFPSIVARKENSTPGDCVFRWSRTTPLISSQSLCREQDIIIGCLPPNTTRSGY